MAYTFLNQQEKLSSLLGDSNTSTADMFPLAQRKAELNRGEIQFAVDAKDIRELASGTVASSQIAIPSDWVSTHVLIINNVVIGNDREVSLSDFERYSNYGGDRGYYYFWEISGVRYFKILGSSGINGYSYSLYYFKKPTTALSADTDVSIHPDEYREAPVYYAASELMRQIGKHQQAMLFRQAYESFVEKAIFETQRTFISKEYARPDFGDSNESPSSDIQGRSYYP